MSDLKRVFSDAEVITNENRARNKNKLTALLELDTSTDCDKLCEFIVKHKIPKRDYMLRVSIVTESYSDGVLVPDYLLTLLCRLRCKLNFSFTKV
jgi:hypothetical protein